MRLCSALSLLASVTVLGRTLSLNTTSDDLAFLNVLRAIFIVFLSLPFPTASLIISAILHLIVAWHTFAPSMQKAIYDYICCVLGADIIALSKLCSERDIVVEDLNGADNIKWTLKGIKHMQFDTTKSYFVLRGFLAFAWRQLFTLFVIEAVIKICVHYKGVVFATIVGAVDRDSDKDASQIFFLCVIWSSLSMTTLVDEYQQSFDDMVYWRLLDILRSKIIGSAASKRGGHLSEAEYSFQYSGLTYRMAQNIRSVIRVLSHSLASLLSIQLLFSRVGWISIQPVAFMVMFSVGKSLVDAKIKAMEKTFKSKLRSKFYNNLDTLLLSIRTIKFYGWEKAFQRVYTSMDLPLFTPPIFWRILGYIITLVKSSATQLATALTVVSYLQSSRALSFMETMIVVSSATNVARFALRCTSVVSGIQDIREAAIALEKAFDNDDKDYVERVEQVGDTAVELDDCAFQWGPDKFSLAPISLSIKAGELAVVVGRVGSGKSSLLSAICSEMPLVSGAGRTYGRIGYVSQKPWIMNATFRENVLFGQEFDEKFYWRVVEACALLDDIKLFPAQDLSEIGPRGINLSGGQKVRLALARAIYSQADVYVLDDLLAAVDAHVERQLIENVLVSNGIIGEMTRILVTHAEHVVPLASKVVTLANGHATTVDQTPAVFTASPPGSPEEVESPSSSDEASGQFILDPEIGVPPFQWSYMWRYLQMSGYHIVGATFVIQAISAYAIFYVDNLRLDMVMDSNKESMVRSVQKYLLMSALVNILQTQIQLLVNWMQTSLWSSRVKEHARKKLVDTLLHMPLPFLESLPSGKITTVFHSERIRISEHLPYSICTQTLGALYAVNAVAHGIQRMPLMLLLILPLVAVMVLVDRRVRFLQKKTSDAFYKNGNFLPMRTFEVILGGQEVMRIHGVLDMHLRVGASRLATYSVILQQNRLIDFGFKGINSFATVAVKSTLLFYRAWRASVLGLPSSPGEIEMTMRLSEIMLSGVKKLLDARGNIKSVLPSLSKYFVYTGLPREASGVIEESRPPQHWPSGGTIEFRDYSMRYRDSLECVLHGISFTVGCNEKIGIVGRTGAGKSSLSYALLRIVEPASGAIFIDGVDISTIGLQDLRSKIGVIPQDPALFVGTIRDNLDPLNEFTDDEVWVAIRKGHIEDLVNPPTQTPSGGSMNSRQKAAGYGLSKWVEDGGKNFSVGQRQLVSLCRALLWKRKILILDEATANVDTKTDQIMQQVIREEFRDSTILTIAHRLRTVMDSDRILVMDQGKVAEYDSPTNLLAQNSLFKSLVESMEFNENR